VTLRTLAPCLALALLCACAALARVTRSVRLGVEHGSGEVDGKSALVGDQGARRSSSESEWWSVNASVEPFAFIPDPDTARTNRTLELIAASIRARNDSAGAGSVGERLLGAAPDPVGAKPAPAVSPTAPAPPTRDAEDEAGGIPGEVWTAIALLVTAVAGWFSRKQIAIAVTRLRTPKESADQPAEEGTE
jgi:hypothetical protein